MNNSNISRRYEEEDEVGVCTSRNTKPTAHLGPDREGLAVSMDKVKVKSCLTLCDPMDCSTPGFPVHHQLLEHAQPHVHQVGDAIHPSHPLSSPSPPAFNLACHRGLFL